MSLSILISAIFSLPKGLRHKAEEIIEKSKIGLESSKNKESYLRNMFNLKG